MAAQVLEQASTKLKMQEVLQHKQYDRPDRSSRCLDQNQQAESKRQHHQQIDISTRNHLVDGELGVKRCRERKRLQ